MATNIPELIAKLEQQQATLGDPLDIPRSTRAFEAFWKTHRLIAGTISGLRSAPADLARAQARLDDAQARRAAVAAKQAEIEQAIAEAPDWRSFADGRDRDREFDRQQLLKRQLELLRDGRLLSAPDQRFEPPDYLDQRITELRERRDRAQCALDSHVQQAEALLAAPVAT